MLYKCGLLGRNRESSRVGLELLAVRTEAPDGPMLRAVLRRPPVRFRALNSQLGFQRAVQPAGQLAVFAG